jgi:DNA-directed RNA polymerase subunit beta
MPLADSAGRSALAPSRENFSHIPEVLPLPNLIQTQIESFHWFVEIGLRELLDEITPISDFTNKNFDLHFRDYYFEDAKFSEDECRTRDLTYSRPLRAEVDLLVKETEEVKSQTVFMGDFPWMTDQGTFIINGAERVVVSQLVRSPGAYYDVDEDAATGRQLYTAKLIPNRGAWLEFETSNKSILSVKVDRKRKIPVTTLLRAVGLVDSQEMLRVFAPVDDNPEYPYIALTLEKDPTTTQEEALVEVYKKLRPGDPPTVENARTLVNSLFFNFRRYDLGRVGRYKLNKALGEVAGKLNLVLPTEEPDTPRESRVISQNDIVALVAKLIALNNGHGDRDDIDHLGNRRIRANGELIQNQFRIGLLRMERVVKERMTITDPEQATPNSLINIRPVVAAMKEFFGGSQLSQFMDQTNPLAELTNKRRLSALGPGGLSRERAGFDVRDVHPSHYGRMCPIETPEGPNIGLIGSLATYGKINKHGFIETPYRRVRRIVSHKDKPTDVVGQTLSEDLVGPDGRRVIAKAGTVVTDKVWTAIKDGKLASVRIRPVVTDQIDYLAADEEEKFYIAQANAPLDDGQHFLEERVMVRYRDKFLIEPADDVDYMDVSPKQIVSVATALIPFLEHDDANRALMGSNMMRQSVPLIVPEAPVVGTGVEYRAALDSQQVVTASSPGTVMSVTADEIVVERDEGDQRDTYRLKKFVRSNQGTCIHQRPIVDVGTRVAEGQVLADSSSTDKGELALGQNILVAFLPWEGGNYEDAIVISERLVRDDLFTSIHIEKHEVEARDTKLGPEEITRDIPNVGDESLRDLNEDGIIYEGAEVQPGDILVGKITPKGETELTAEERLLRAIFGEKAREVKDSSLRLPHGERGIVVEVREFSREQGDELAPGVNRLVRVSVAQKRKVAVGDKMAGRHGNKGVIAKILPAEDMPFMPDGTPVDIVLNPLGVPSRMNIGQILETHLGWAMKVLGLKAETPVFDGATEDHIRERLEQAGLPPDGKSVLYDGRTGDAFDQPVTVGHIYMLKLHHLVEDKIHARSTGPYSLITQQPLGGKAQFGGQRFGEMEVWALEAYGAANILQELLTVKSDDVLGRVQTYEAIVKGEEIQSPGVPESFKVLIKELQALGLSVEILNENEEEIRFVEDTGSYPLPDLGGINLQGFEE